MIEEQIVISDANIFIDLISVNLLDSFFSLPCKIATSDFVINEIENPEQKKEINRVKSSKKLDIVTFDSSELMEISSIFEHNNNNASIPDCSVWYYAKKTNGRLLTGDSKLRKSALADHVKVSGILYIFDNFIEYEILSKKDCATKLEELTSINFRLPRGECQKRIESWHKE